MKPILYEADETEFKSNGLGRLSPLDGYVIEERNGVYELTMTVSMADAHYKDLKYGRILYVKHNDSDDKQPFVIYKITRPLNGKVEVCAEHTSYRLNYIPVMPFTASNCAAAMSGLKNNAAEDCPFEFWTDKDVDTSFTLNDVDSIKSVLGGSSGSILSTYKGEYEWDKFIVKLFTSRGKDNGVTLRYGKNITDLSQEENIQNTYTGILPFWKGQDDNGNDIDVYLPEKVLHSDNYKNFPYARTVSVDFSSTFQNQPTEEQLRERAQSYMVTNNIGVPKVTCKVSFVALWQTEEYKDIAPLEHVNLCDTVHVVFDDLEIETEAKVIRTEYDFLKERYNSIEIGDAKSSLGETLLESFADDIQGQMVHLASKSELAKSIDRATQLITGGLGGYVTVRLNADGKPQEILILGDDPDYTKAQQVWRWNKNGLGYSSTGYNGDFKAAITVDGQIVADFITTGTLDAAQVKVINLDAQSITSGTIDASKIGVTNLNADNITSGSIDASEIAVKNINADNITSGTISADKIKGGTIDASEINVDNLDAKNITSGTFSSDRYGDDSISVSKLTGSVSNSSGWTVDLSNESISVGEISADKITAGLINGNKLGIASNIYMSTSGTYLNETHATSLFSDGRVFGVDAYEGSGAAVMCPRSYYIWCSYLSSASHINFYENGSYVGYIASEYSDERLKENIKPLSDDYINAIGNVILKQFNLKNNPNNLRFGIIAQDLEKQLEEAGLTDSLEMLFKFKYKVDDTDEYYGVNYTEFLVARIAYDEKRIASLEERISALEKRLA